MEERTTMTLPESTLNRVHRAHGEIQEEPCRTPLWETVDEAIDELNK